MRHIFTGIFAVLCSHSAFAGNTSSEIRVSPLKEPTSAVIDGKNVFLYELLIQNGGATDVRLKELNVDGNQLGSLHLGAEKLSSYFKLLTIVDFENLPNWLAAPKLTPAAPGIDALTIPKGRSALIFLELSASLVEAIPHQIHHHLKIEAIPEHRPLEIDQDVRLASVPPLVLASPFAGGSWFPFNGPTNDSAHRRSVQRFRGRYYIAQRFAIDWGGLGDEGRLVRNGRTAKQNDSYYGYGTPVYAVADATVEKSIDGISENVPDTDVRSVTINEQTIAGNSVILDLGGGHYALYAHLQPGRLKVKKGDHVHRGQFIGLLGNSGNSTGPHLHFHVCDGPSALECQGVPYVFENFRHQGVEAKGEGVAQLRLNPFGPVMTSILELIWNNQEIDFGRLPN